MYNLEEKNYCVKMVKNLKNEGIYGIKTGYYNCLPNIKLLMVHNAPYYLNYQSINQLLINELCFKKSTASEIVKVADRFYFKDGSIDPFYKDFQYTVLVKLAQRYTDKQLQLLRKNGILSCRLTRNDLEWVHSQYCRLLFGNDYMLTVG